MSTRKTTEVRRTELADAALEVIARRGIAALTTRAVGEALGLSDGALFRHFSSRDALLLGVAERVAALMDATYPSASLPPHERLAELAQARLALVATHVGVLSLVQSEQFALALPAEAAEALRGVVRQTHGFVVQAMVDGQREGVIRADVAADGLALLFMGALQMTALARRTGAVTSSARAIEALDALIRPNHTPEKS